MNVHTLPLRRPLLTAWADALRLATAGAYATWQAYLARRHVELAERELLELNLRTLEDIGAPQGLIGQRRWQDEQAAAEIDRLMSVGRR